VLSLLALLPTIMLVKVLHPAFANLLSVANMPDPGMLEIAMMTAICLGVGLINGLYPALVLARAKPVDVLKAQAACQLAEQEKWGEAWTDSGYICTKEDGTPYHPEVVSRYFRQAVKEAKLPTIRPHDLRHTHATLALRAGIHPKVVSERLGHATVSITLDTYSHAIPAMQEEAAALIAGLVFAKRQWPLPRVVLPGDRRPLRLPVLVRSGGRPSQGVW